MKTAKQRVIDTQKAIDDIIAGELEKVDKEMNIAEMQGKRSINLYESLTKPTIKALREMGYTVTDNTCQIEGTLITVSW